ncbi:hypothetical protein [Vibrio crassostreae]|uniref:hypothetical protein n=1 Tax=Vibrio crassostreae TaxID=246167 RepID=UPI001B30801A|nr:hypothetical protein [Vibrio crassostreae]
MNKALIVAIYLTLPLSVYAEGRVVGNNAELSVSSSRGGEEHRVIKAGGKTYQTIRFESEDEKCFTMISTTSPTNLSATQSLVSNTKQKCTKNAPKRLISHLCPNDTNEKHLINYTFEKMEIKFEIINQATGATVMHGHINDKGAAEFNVIDCTSD